MKNKVDILEERLNTLNNILGEIDTTDYNSRSSSRIVMKDRLKNISDVITLLQKEISENDSITFKEVYKKCKTFNFS
jgi:cell fate (sporulation/competence/biofilm development) regulator YmcA (YheA/YmcA/DUF963 family)